MDSPVRVLHVIAGMGSGGAESFLMNMCRHMDRDKIQFDFLLRSNENIYFDELNSLGCRVYYTAPFPRHWLKNILQTWRIIKQNQYKIIHVHANALLYVFPLMIAKKLGVPCRIMHSHSTFMLYSKARIIHDYNKRRIHEIATDCFACSERAGKWMYGDRYRIINNAIDVDKFKFDQIAREKIRRDFNIPAGAFVVGHVGRFWPEKNHVFLLRVFCQLLQEKPNAYLVLIGEGGLESKIKDLACDLGISDRVIFAGVRKDVNKALSAFDVFAFPSIYEGLGIVVIEAQANGLATVCSEAVPDNAILLNNVKRISLDQGPQFWADTIMQSNTQRVEPGRHLAQGGFDINIEAKKLQDYYCEHG